ncbi:S8 family peptidase [Natrarchaeobius chitinivorans]|uniref:S8 family peptidase n=1 Tax=Natrarchaeobius chitinivorans TaxID=1679083 RepID=UPI0014050AF5|nr:S8 family serine peptidase [Natrarchaeobius chitinivorans]
MPSTDFSEHDRRSVLKAAGALGALFGSSGVASATPERAPGPKKEELLVGVSPSASDIERTVQSGLTSDADVVHSNEVINYVSITFPAQTPEEAKERVKEALERIDEIEYVEENATIEALHTPNDPHYGSQHAPQQVNCEGAWERTLGDDDVVISVVDQAVQYDHENLEPNVDDRIGEVFVGRMNTPYPATSNETHGTIVAGIAAGATDNGTGHAGISNCTFLSARALDERGSGSLSDVADAIQWSADNGADVINLSLASSSDWRTLENACEYAVEQGCLLVGGAGNDGGSVLYPAAYDSVIAVSALTSSDRLASFSNRGSAIELAAPGTSLVSTDLNDSYTRASGTSMSTPVVSGVAGLVLSAYPDLPVETLREHLRKTATDVGLSSHAQGYGRVDANAAVNTVPDGYEPDDGDGEDEDETEDDEDDEEEPAGRLLAFITEPDARSAGYEFTADGPVEFADAPYESPSGGSIEGGTYTSEDFVEEDDGTWHAGGVTGGGHGDAFWVDGPVTSIDLEQPDGMWLELDREELSPEEVIAETGGEEDEEDDEEDETEADLLAFITESDTRGAGYEFTAEGPVEFADAPYETPSGGSIEGGTYTSEDFVEEDDGTWHAGGVTGGGHGDAFWVDGPVTSIDLEQPDGMWLELNRERLSPEEVIDATGGDGSDDENDGDDDGDENDGDEDEDEPDRCGAETETASVESSLRASWWGGSDRWSYALRTSSPCGATITIDGPSDADFDLYVTTDGSRPSRTSYDEASTGDGSDEEATVDLSGGETIRILVRAVDGSGNYTLTIEERGR